LEEFEQKRHADTAQVGLVGIETSVYTGTQDVCIFSNNGVRIVDRSFANQKAVEEFRNASPKSVVLGLRMAGQRFEEIGSACENACGFGWGLIPAAVWIRTRGRFIVWTRMIPPAKKNGFNLPSTKDTQLLFGDEIKRSQWRSGMARGNQERHNQSADENKPEGKRRKLESAANRGIAPKW
jgi:hypothetical protein